MKKQADIQIGEIVPPDGPLSPTGGSAPLVLNNVISSVVGFLSIVAAIWFIFQFMTAALAIIGSGGDPSKIAEARQRITSSAIGLVLAIAGIFIADLIGSILGIDILDPGGAVSTLN